MNLGRFCLVICCRIFWFVREIQPVVWIFLLSSLGFHITVSDPEQKSFQKIRDRKFERVHVSPMTLEIRKFSGILRICTFEMSKIHWGPALRAMFKKWLVDTVLSVADRL